MGAELVAQGKELLVKLLPTCDQSVSWSGDVVADVDVVGADEVVSGLPLLRGSAGACRKCRWPVLRIDVEALHRLVHVVAHRDDASVAGQLQPDRRTAAAVDRVVDRLPQQVVVGHHAVGREVHVAAAVDADGDCSRVGPRRARDVLVVSTVSVSRRGLHRSKASQPTPAGLV